MIGLGLGSCQADLPSQPNVPFLAWPRHRTRCQPCLEQLRDVPLYGVWTFDSRRHLHQSQRRRSKVRAKRRRIGATPSSQARSRNAARAERSKLVGGGFALGPRIPSPAAKVASLRLGEGLPAGKLNDGAFKKRSDPAPRDKSATVRRSALSRDRARCKAKGEAPVPWSLPRVRRGHGTAAPSATRSQRTVCVQSAAGNVDGAV